MKRTAVALAALLLAYLAVVAASAPPPARRLPRPYPGCTACQVAHADDVARLEGRELEFHQLIDHTGGIRW